VGRCSHRLRAARLFQATAFVGVCKAQPSFSTTQVRWEGTAAKSVEGVEGARSLLVTGSDHPYASNFWSPGHIIGYEHTFIAALADFLRALENGAPFHPDFEDGLQVERVLAAIEKSAATNGSACAVSATA